MLKICVVGLGYVGYPLADEFSKHYSVVGFDINEQLIGKILKDQPSFEAYSDWTKVKEVSCYVVTVPTPVTDNQTPDFAHLISACKLIGPSLKRNDLVIFESTVFPGATDDILTPQLEKLSKLIAGKDFGVGYSPERVSPGKNSVSVTNIKKITSAINDKWLQIVDDLYISVISAGTFRASSIKVAEAAKVLENTQRDVNIALINEFSIISEKLGISTSDVLEAASTKWNFLKFSPGLVGGHCIGIDPYYLVHKAKSLGYYPEIMSSARRVNESVVPRIITKLTKDISNTSKKLSDLKALFLGITFKENCDDIRNSKALELALELSKIISTVDCYDPYINQLQPNLQCLTEFPISLDYDVIFIAVKHDEFLEEKISHSINSLDRDCLVYDLLNIYKSDTYFSL